MSNLYSIKILSKGGSAWVTLPGTYRIDDLNVVQDNISAKMKNQITKFTLELYNEDSNSLNIINGDGLAAISFLAH